MKFWAIYFVSSKRERNRLRAQKVLASEKLVKLNNFFRKENTSTIVNKIQNEIDKTKF